MYWILSLPVDKSSPVEYLWLLSTVNFLICGSKITSFPEEITSIFVSVEEYPIPELITLTSYICPEALTTALNSAPVPEPVTTKSGTE